MYTKKQKKICETRFIVVLALLLWSGTESSVFQTYACINIVQNMMITSTVSSLFPLLNWELSNNCKDLNFEKWRQGF